LWSAFIVKDFRDPENIPTVTYFVVQLDADVKGRRPSEESNRWPELSRRSAQIAGQSALAIFPHVHWNLGIPSDLENGSVSSIFMIPAANVGLSGSDAE